MQGALDRVARHIPVTSEANVVFIGGGTSGAVLARIFKDVELGFTAISPATDDGGSTGELRRLFGVSAIGDIRQILMALSNLSPEALQVLAGRWNGDPLTGHNNGNLFLAQAERLFDLPIAIAVMREVLQIREGATVIPVTRNDLVELVVELNGGAVIRGERHIDDRTAETDDLRIKRVWVESVHGKEITFNPEAAHAVERADLIIFGPGSMYTSTLANTSVPGLVEAVQDARSRGAVVAYICNLVTNAGQTDDMHALDHVDTFNRHTVGADGNLIDVVVANKGALPADLLETYLRANQQAVYLPEHMPVDLPYRLIVEDLVDTQRFTSDPNDPLGHVRSVLRHDLNVLAGILFDELSRAVITRHQAAVVR